MLDALKNPPEPFEDVIRTHFRLKAKSISSQLDDWLEKDDGKSTAYDGAEISGEMLHGRARAARSGTTFATDVKEMKQLLSKLEDGTL
jgi:hypothetical protein